MRLGASLLLAYCAACGRLDFGPLGGGNGAGGNTDGSIGGDGSGMTSDGGTCPGGMQLPIDSEGTPAGSWVSTLAAASLGSGFAALYIAPDATLYATTYTTTGTPKQDVVDDALGSDIVAAGLIADGSDLLIAQQEGSATTVVVELSPTLTQRSGPQPYVGSLATTPLATSGDGTTHALLLTNSGLLIQPVTASGTPAGSASTLEPSFDGADSARVASGTAGYVATWRNGLMAPMEIGVISLGASFATIAGPVTIASTGGNSMAQPSVAAASTGNILVAWAEGAGATNEIWMEIRDATLAVVVAPTQIGTGTAPIVTSDGTDFLIAWDDPSSPSNLTGAHVKANGTYTAHPIAGSGGTAMAYDAAILAGSIGLVWAERGGTGPPLWATPQCAL
jgi:hypothetical protein